MASAGIYLTLLFEFSSTELELFRYIYSGIRRTGLESLRKSRPFPRNQNLSYEETGRRDFLFVLLLTRRSHKDRYLLGPLGTSFGIFGPRFITSRPMLRIFSKNIQTRTDRGQKRQGKGEKRRSGGKGRERQKDNTVR